MSHKPSVPQGSVSPYPLRTADAEDRADDKLELAEKARSGLGETSRRDEASGWGRFAAGSAIGCAAVAAAMLYWNRSKTR